MSISIQALTTNDKASWQLLWQAYLSFYKTTVADEISENTWQNILKAEQILGFGAYQNGKLVGIVHIVLHPNTWNNNNCCYLEDLFVDEAMRGHGLGRALIEYVYEFAKQNDCNRVYWVTNSDNQTAQQLYDNLARRTDMIQYRFDIQ